MLSTPVCGVEVRKDTVAPLLAPSFRNDMAVGITPQEQSGKGMPKAAAFSTEPKLRFERWFEYILRGRNT